MTTELSYVLLTPYTIVKSRTGGVISRLLSRVDLELVAAQMIAPTEAFAQAYANNIYKHSSPTSTDAARILHHYILQSFFPSEGRRHRVLLLLFRGENALEKLREITGPLFAQDVDFESIKGETIRDTYGDLIHSKDNPNEIRYIEPAVLAPQTMELARKNLLLFKEFTETQSNIVAFMEYPESVNVQRTLVIIKPDNWKHASSRPGTIIDMFSRTGLRIIATKVYQMSVAEALRFYGPVEAALQKKLAPLAGEWARDLLEEHFEMTLDQCTNDGLTDCFGRAYAKDQFYKIVEFMSGSRPDQCAADELERPGKVKSMVLVYEGENAVEKIRRVLGPTDPTKAPGGTIRRDFGSDIMVNTAHASDSADNAKREMGIVKIEENNLAAIIGDHLK